MIKYFVKFLLSSKNEHSLHSPFVFELYTKVISAKTKNPIFIEIENLRKKLLRNKTVIEITDFGAGSRIYKTNQREIRQIAKNAEKKPKFGKLIFRLIQWFKPSVIFDLGTSLGMTTIYESKACENAQIITFEGCPATAAIAQKNFEASNCQNISLIIGNIDETLPKVINQIEQLDFAFFDANHRYHPTVNYFEICLQKATEESVFVFDDIHWSDEMNEAWQYIKNHSQVMVSIDLFFVGLVFFRKNQPKQDFVLRF
ncbi:class I SAM-dependent methyltransferase [Arcicella sp. LKC2W]|uniref:O-methyltransferase n=1 Tax=Arcicella sp. LKC2W TaxID=2984198 RepID=UPI002B1F8D84|nr:class I SAM-dependent methyltransferase [Arcicella sp. LKC2W]MEA5460559.1 class I SAM-dependent methyltransferase [Arcicella sp. LKC2W]